MSETDTEIQGEQPAPVEPEAEQPEPGYELPDDPEGEDDLEEDEPSEEDAELLATVEREHELAAERQEEIQSVEAQQRDQDAKRKKLNQVAAHTAKRYGEILGDDLDGFVVCPLCGPWFPGIRLNVMPDYETISAVKVAIGEDPDPPLTNDQYSRECDACGGLGKVLTGSKVQGQGTAQCLPCKGRGWVSVGPERDQGQLTSAPPAVYASVPDVGVELGEEPPEAKALRDLGFIVVPPVSTPESLAARGG